jgi:pimeloyl-ACP methyl ester carboxylesterase
MATPQKSEFNLRGYQAPQPSSSALRSDLAKIKAEFRPGSFRSGTEREAEVRVADGNLVEIEFEDGLRVWLTGKEYREKLEKEGKRAPSAAGPVEVPDTLPFGGTEASSRGIVGWVLKALKVVEVDVAAQSALTIARKFEDKIEAPKRRGPGFYRCGMVSGDFALHDAGASIDADRLLLFIHGTASSTWGSFGELWSPARSATLAGLKAIYGENVFALDHRSITESPITNALALAKELRKRVRKGARIDVISHSRGGLVGELVCRMNIAGGGVPFEGIDEKLVADTDWLKSDANLDKHDLAKAKKALEGAAAELKSLGNELKNLAKDGVAVNRFVRVACPALGTSLVSRRLDRWVQILANVGALAAKTTPIGELVDSLGDFITAVLHQKTKPHELPGIAAMLPDAGFISMVNNPTREIGSRLVVIAGDIEPEGIWQRLLTLIADKFYAGEHDLVVNTGSMYGGAPREQGAALLSYHAGAAVSHFNYFKNEASAQAIVTALGHPEIGFANVMPPGFEPLRPAVKPIAREVVRGTPGPRHIVFVLPGIMGSELTVGRDRVWLNFSALFLGGLEKLQIGADNVAPFRPYGQYYGDLIEYLAESHKVIAFPYDWRLSPEVEAKRLAQDVQRAVREAKAVGKSVRILAHSMGGLIARTMIKNHPDVWAEMAAEKGARLVMLGTPNGGSHSINELIVGQSGTLKKLALLDVTHSMTDLLRIITRFPGVLSLLPGAKDGADDYLAPDTWKRYKDAHADGWVEPDAQDLKGTKAFRTIIDASPIDADKMVYVAGQAPVTLVRMFLDGAAKGSSPIRFVATARGDGQVPWDTGIPAGLKAWYMPGVVHGNLPSVEEHFPAIFDLLETGTTARLRQEEPVSRAAAAEFVVEREPEENLPDEPTLAAAVLGATVLRPKRRAEPDTKVKVTVMHGHLKFADNPVLVGHYKGDTIISAERVLDNELGGRLTQRHRLGLYPDDIATCEIVLKPRRDVSDRWSGAVVVGLGPVGELGVGNLVATVAHGALHYAVKIAERAIESGDADEPREIQAIGLSALLVGTNAGGVRGRDSVLAVLEGVATANQSLAREKRPVRITSLQFVELFQSKALQAIEDIAFVAAATRFKGVFDPPARIDRKRGACSQLVFKEQEGWWQRLQIKGKAAEGQPNDGSLHFVELTRRARAPARVVATQRKLVDQFVRRTIRETRHDPELTRTLFELLLPNAVKESAPDRDNVVLVLDEEAARYPWELLENRWDGSGVPLALNRGLLRQLEVARLRENPVYSLGASVLVIGDPLLDENGPLKPLPGAREEAHAVVDVLEQSGRFDMSSHVQAGAAEIVRALFAQSYRVIHLAGHGVYEWEVPRAKPADDQAGKPASDTTTPRRPGEAQVVTGMVLGNDVFLTPAEIEQMRRVPELVFINCCHLGAIEDREHREREEAAEGKPRMPGPLSDYNLFAANVATQFIRLGVRAVIAAGWAVDDAAGKAFAVAFYDAMTKGENFGTAVRRAREQTYAAHPYRNTWGAYQCYGDPDYVLVSTPVERPDRPPSFASIELAINRLENLASEIESSGGDNLGAQLKALDALRKLIEDDNRWRSNGRGWSALGAAYNLAFQFDVAVECFYTAIGCEDGGLTVRDLEQLSNCESRAAVAKWRAGVTDAEKAKLRKQVQIAIDRLDALLQLPKTVKAGADGDEARSSETRERLSLLASAYKRKAWITEDKAARVAALESMGNYYRRAAEWPGSAGDRAYPIINWAASALVLKWHGKPVTKSEDNDIKNALEQRRGELEQQVRERRDLWDVASLADLMLIIALRENALDSEYIEKLVKRYEEVRRLASAREYESVREQIDFLAETAETTGSAVAKKLKDLVAKLSATTVSPRPSGDDEPTDGSDAGATTAPVRARAGAQSRSAPRGAPKGGGRKRK